MSRGSASAPAISTPMTPAADHDRRRAIGPRCPPGPGAHRSRGPEPAGHRASVSPRMIASSRTVVSRRRSTSTTACASTRCSRPRRQDGPRAERAADCGVPELGWCPPAARSGPAPPPEDRPPQRPSRRGGFVVFRDEPTRTTTRGGSVEDAAVGRGSTADGHEPLLPAPTLPVPALGPPPWRPHCPRDRSTAGFLTGPDAREGPDLSCERSGPFGVPCRPTKPAAPARSRPK